MFLSYYDAGNDNFHISIVSVFLFLLRMDTNLRQAISVVSVSPMRKEPSHRAEMVSQLLFGESCQILEEQADWKRIRCDYDNYEGWCHAGQISDYQMAGSSTTPEKLSNGWISEIRVNERKMFIPLGSTLNVFMNRKARIGDLSFVYKGDLFISHSPGYNWLLEKAMMYLNTPYLWGGRSVFGIDCSGYTQAVYKFFGIRLYRDAWQQADQGQRVNELQEAKIGDLAFFDNEEGRITHVGILLNEQEIIHSSGKVRIDRIDSKGIIHNETGHRTHKLRLIKRYF